MCNLIIIGHNVFTSRLHVLCLNMTVYPGLFSAVHGDPHSAINGGSCSDSCVSCSRWCRQSLFGRACKCYRLFLFRLQVSFWTSFTKITVMCVKKIVNIHLHVRPVFLSSSLTCFRFCLIDIGPHSCQRGRDDEWLSQSAVCTVFNGLRLCVGWRFLPVYIHPCGAW